MSSNFRQNVNTWGTIVFGVLITASGSHQLYKYLTRDRSDDRKDDRSQIVKLPLVDTGVTFYASVAATPSFFGITIDKP